MIQKSQVQILKIISCKKYNKATYNIPFSEISYDENFMHRTAPILLQALKGFEQGKNAQKQLIFGI